MGRESNRHNHGSKREKLGEMRSSERARMRDIEEREKETDICE